MADLQHWFGGDLAVTLSGDLQLATPTDTGTQRVYRRLLTNPQLSDASGNPVASADYVWHPTYGAGVPRKVGSPGNVPATKALIKGQMLLETAVAPSPAPVINLTQTNNAVSAEIQYTDANTATPQFVSFDLGT